MNKMLSSALVATLLAAPAFAFAQSNDTPITRAEVRAELVAASQTGQLSTNDVNYPQVVASGTTNAPVQALADTSSNSAGASISGSHAAGDGTSSSLFSVYRGQ
jgi:Domain of unknown function (DUF4148)